MWPLLQTAVDEMAPVVDEILFAGDAVYEYRMSNEIVDLIRATGMHYVLGNHEIELLSPGGVRRAKPKACGRTHSTTSAPSPTASTSTSTASTS